MGTKGREVPRVVCCAIPIASAANKVLVITSRKRQDVWVCAYLFFISPRFFIHRNARTTSVGLPGPLSCNLVAFA